MKKTTTALLAALGLSAAMASAAPLSPSEALTRALGSGPMKAPGRSYELALSRSFQGTDALYVFTNAAGEGFLITSADDSAPALLGYGTGKFLDENGNPAPGMKYWLGELAREIAYGAEHPAMRATALTRPVRNPIEPLCSTQWNQSTPYNDDCPELNGEKCVTGCVATSTSQVLKYHNWPVTGSGSNSYTWQGQELSIDFSQITFDWDNMSDIYNDSSTEAQQAAVAQLMQAVGYSVDMDYNVASADGSGASSINVGPALISNFGYCGSLRYLVRDWYPLLEWEGIIYDSLTDYGPVIYNGVSEEGGHSFVCDGYSEDGYFHINWGWGGLCDGYFLLSGLHPEVQGIGGTESNLAFDSGQNVICDITPDRTGRNAASSPIMTCSSTLQLSYDDSEGVIVLSNMIYNAGPCEMLNEVCGLEFIPVGLIDDMPEGEGQYEIYSLNSQNSYGETVGLKPGYGLQNVGFEIPSNLSEGRYLVRLVYGTEAQAQAGTLQSVKVNAGTTTDYVLNIGSSNITLTATTPLNVTAADVTYQTNFCDNEEITATGSLSNKFDFSSTANVKALILPLDENSVLASTSVNPCTVASNTEDSLDFASKLDDYDNLEAGQYRVMLAADDNAGGYYKMTEPKTITYIVSTGVTELTLSDTLAAEEVFTVSGIKADRNFDDLPAGVYVVNGRKVLK